MVSTAQYTASVVYNAIHDHDLSGLDPHEDYSDYGLHRYHAFISYQTEAGDKDLTNLLLDIQLEFGFGFDEHATDFCIEKDNGEYRVYFQTTTWYWYADSWDVPLKKCLAHNLGCDPKWIADAFEA